MQNHSRRVPALMPDSRLPLALRLALTVSQVALKVKKAVLRSGAMDQKNPENCEQRPLHARETLGRWL